MIIDGKAIAQSIRKNVAQRIKENFSAENAPCLACILVGNDKASQIYVNSKKKACEECGIKSLILNVPEDVSKAELVALIEKLNADKNVSGILLQLPLPDHLRAAQNEIINTILPTKDVDCLTDLNLEHRKLLLARQPE